MTLQLKSVLLLLMCSMASMATASPVTDCVKVLEVGRLTTINTAYLVKYSNYFNAFCSTTIETSAQASQRSAQFGIDLEELPLNFESSSRDSDTRNYFSKLCQAIKSNSGSLADIRQTIESLDAKIHGSFETCIGRPGIHLWAESDLGEPGEIRLFLKYVKDETGPSNVRLARTFSPTPNDAFAQCSAGAFEKGQKIEASQTSEAACIIREKYLKRKSVVVTFNIEGLPPKTKQVLLPKPTAATVLPVPPAPSVQKDVAKKPKKAVLLAKYDGNSLEALAGDWLDFPLQYISYSDGIGSESTRAGTKCYSYDVDIKGPEIALLDEDDELQSWGLRVQLVDYFKQSTVIRSGQISGRSSQGLANWLQLSYQHKTNCSGLPNKRHAYIFSTQGRQDVGLELSYSGNACNGQGVVNGSNKVTIAPWAYGSGWECNVKARLCYYAGHPNYSAEGACPK